MKKIYGQIRTWIYVCGGNFMYALALALFLTDNNIAAGGLAGIAVIMGKYIPLGVGILTLFMNIPILIGAIVINGWRYTINTIVAAVMYAVTVELFGKLPVLTNDPLVAAVFGGVFYGIGMALLTIGNGSIGGTDLLCRLLNKKFPFISVAKLSLIIDGGVVLLAIIAFGNVEIGLYAIIAIVVCSAVADRLVMGIEQGSICMIVTAADAKQIADPLMEILGKAVTRWDGNGMYTGEERKILIVAIRPKEVHTVKGLLKKIEPNAFVIVIPANELIGGHFSKIRTNDS